MPASETSCPQQVAPRRWCPHSRQAGYRSTDETGQPAGTGSCVPCGDRRGGARSMCSSRDARPVRAGVTALRRRGRWIPGTRREDPFTEADPVATLVTFLTATGNLLGARPHAVAGEDPHPARLSSVLVGQTSSGRKGSSRGAPMRILAAVDEEWSRYCVASGLSSGEGLIFHVRDAREEQQPIKEKGR